MRVAIVNDMPLAIEALKRLILSNPAFKIAWTAANGDAAIRNCLADKPDVILMDLVMPGISGAETTREIMKKSPCAILVVTATVAGNFKLVNEAMGYGAYDAVETPSINGNTNSASQLMAKLVDVERINQRLQGNTKITPAPPTKPAFVSPGGSQQLTSLPPIVAIGCSTGGPAALELILSQLKSTFPAAILVSQHIGEEFAASLVQWLTSRCKLRIRAAEPGNRPEAGTVYIAATSNHLILATNGTLQYSPHPIENPYRPSVDALFNSIADAGCQPRVAVLLTGIGNDGARGLLRLRQAGWHTIAQDEATCVVYGMPQAAAKLGAASRVLALQDIPFNLEAFLSSSSPHSPQR
jgi:two-component system, chemotaxis family, response regulator WspF